MTIENLKAAPLTNLDATPYIPNTRGQGAIGDEYFNDGFVAATASGLGSVGSTYRLCRIPTGAILKNVLVATDVALDTGTHALSFDLNIAFSDSTIDGTPAALQGLVPTTANTGATTSFSTYSSPNKMFGAVNNTSASVAFPQTNVTFNGSRTNYPFSSFLQQPLWQAFGFVDGRGNPADPNGWFDLVAYVGIAAGTAAPGNLYGRVSFVY